MKKQTVYWIIIGVLTVIILVQFRLNQSKSEPKLNKGNQSEIGRFQYFVDPNSNFGGFLDTKEGFAYVWVSGKWQVWDIKEQFESHFRSEYIDLQTRLSDKNLSKDSSAVKFRERWLIREFETLTSNLKRIGKD
jgi:hypothetical protein